jgi:hypothetical protein
MLAVEQVLKEGQLHLCDAECPFVVVAFLQDVVKDKLSRLRLASLMYWEVIEPTAQKFVQGK